MRQGKTCMLTPLIKMCGSKEKFDWSDNDQIAFNLVKNKIANNAMLVHPNLLSPLTCMLIVVCII